MEPIDRFTFCVCYFQPRGEYLARCVEFPALSWLAAEPEQALLGIRSAVLALLPDWLGKE